MQSVTPSVQSPRAYDQANLTAEKLGQRLAAGVNNALRGNLRAAQQDDGYAFQIHPVEDAYGLVDADLTFGYLPGEPERYGAVGDGVTDDRAALTICFGVWRAPVLTAGKIYYCGLVTSNAAVFSFSGVGSVVIDFNGASITCETSGGNYNAALFELDDVDGFTLYNPKVSDAGFDQGATWKGITVVRLHPANGVVRNVNLFGVDFANVVTSIDTDTSANRAYRINIDGQVRNAYYGINLGNNGDDVYMALLAYNCVRSYFCYGVVRHRGFVTSDTHAAAGNADFLVKCRDAAFPTRDIRLTFTSKNSQATTNPQLVFESQNDAGDAAISDVEIIYTDTESPLVAHSIAFRHYSNAGALQATDPNTKARVRVKGFARGSIAHNSVPTAYQDQDLDRCQGLLPSFMAYKSAQTNNVTGDGTVYDVVFDTELHDHASNYDNASGVFTAHRDGLYRFSGGVSLLGVTAAETRVDVRLVTSVKTLYYTATNTANPPSPEACIQIPSPDIYLKSGQTAKVQVAAFNGTKVVDVFGDSTVITTWFSGSLVRGGPKSL